MARAFAIQIHRELPAEVSFPSKQRHTRPVELKCCRRVFMECMRIASAPVAVRAISILEQCQKAVCTHPATSLSQFTLPACHASSGAYRISGLESSTVVLRVNIASRRRCREKQKSRAKGGGRRKEIQWRLGGPKSGSGESVTPLPGFISVQ